MQVEVRLYATLRKYLPEQKVGEDYPITLPEEATVADLLAALGIPEADSNQAFVNGRAGELSQMLRHGDKVGVFPPVAGGEG